MQNAGLDVSFGHSALQDRQQPARCRGAGPPTRAIRDAESSRTELRRQEYATVRAARPYGCNRWQPLGKTVKAHPA